MKVKSLFMSMLAIASLASCSQNDELDPVPGAKGQKAQVTIRVQGTGKQTRASGTGDHSQINDLTVFFFNEGDNLVSKSFFSNTQITGGNTAKATTTTEAKKVVVIANLGSDMTQGKFLAVNSLGGLKSVTQDLMTTDQLGATPHQTDNAVFMSGIGNVQNFADNPTVPGEKKATANVSLHFVGSKIAVTKIGWGDKGGKGDYTTNFTIAGVYLMDAQTSTNFLPVNETSTEYIADGERKFAGGREWTSPWVPNDMHASFKVFNALKKTPAAPATGTKKIEDLGHWFVFSNEATTGHPTVLVVEVDWKDQIDGEHGATADHITKKYFTVHFDGTDAGGNKIVSGRTYDVSIMMNGNFLPTEDGGTGGGGGDNPQEPTVNASVEVTITPAAWTVVTVDKEFGGDPSNP